MADEFRNPFKELDKKLRDVPPEMRKKVMNDVAIAKFFMDLAILVTSNYSSLLAGLFRTNRRK
ncbi:hypothetical protein [Allomuricauda sp. SCSIO 65647]|uniref:hypothetical protein n=1 Tax=Allomuricauda sp. SCSIO 65647 TaxID=2908843 RepID=UPI001F456B3F|nr:hypothetical protein [Muricauda sp. SCSIO 65647]UJH68139.1 hypothetical protein L0P89_02770 [Muricauda sp. SCSIO 65647]